MRDDPCLVRMDLSTDTVSRYVGTTVMAIRSKLMSSRLFAAFRHEASPEATTGISLDRPAAYSDMLNLISETNTFAQTNTITCICGERFATPD